jgi:hypothetical protein
MAVYYELIQFSDYYITFHLKQPFNKSLMPSQYVTVHNVECMSSMQISIFPVWSSNVCVLVRGHHSALEPSHKCCTLKFRINR